MKRVSVGIVAPSSKIPEIEFRLGVEKIEKAGFRAYVHPHCKKSHLFFAGTDEQRAQAFYDYAVDPRFSVIWCARGGYGAVRILPILERITAERGVPEKKLMLGYSDATALHEFVRNRWGWRTLHSPMPGMRKFCVQSSAEWSSLGSWIRGESPENVPWEKKALRLIGGAKLKAPITGRLVGGNLTVWTSLVGTPYLSRARDRILFFEDVDESLYRLDRMLQQLVLAGALNGARAIVLGNFLNCRDVSSKVLAARPSSKSVLLSPGAKDLKPLRKELQPARGIREIFGAVGARLGIPVAEGLPVGHGPGIASLPLGADYRLDPNGRLRLLKWDWLR